LAIKVGNPNFKIEGFTFPTEFDKSVAQYFLDKGRDFLFALSVDYPGLYEIPMCYLERVRKELKEAGFMLGYGKNYSDTRLRVAIFYLGPRRQRPYGGFDCRTRKEDARSFKLLFLCFNTASNK